MAESQSRYGIVADLTGTKLEIISAKASLDNEVKVSKQKVERMKSEFSDWRQGIKAENERQEREYNRKIKEAEIEARNCEERKKGKEQSFDLKLKAIDDALSKIEAISEASAKEASVK